MAQVTDPYKVLGVSRDADKETIKKAYRKLAKQYHPDTHPNDKAAAEKMNEINQAYDMLTDPDKYARTTGSSAGSYQYGNPFGYGNYGYGNYRNGTYGSGGQNPYGNMSGNGGNYHEYKNFWDMYDDVFEKQGMNSAEYREFQERLRRQQQRQQRQSSRRPSVLKLLWRGFWFLLFMEFLLKSCSPVGYYYYDPYDYQQPYGYEQQIQEVPGTGNGYYEYGPGGNGYVPGGNSNGQPVPEGAL